MTERILELVSYGGTAILYLLIGLSLLSVAVIIERGFAYARGRIDLPAFSARVVNLLNDDDHPQAVEAARALKAPEARVVAEGLLNFDKGPAVAGQLMEAMSIRQQQRLDRNLGILGTVGSNAPFVGLLGTVMGIIKAFHDLALDTGGGPSVVMAGISEALVATAAGLFVAIPAVVFFNHFKNRQKRIASNIGQMQKMLLAFIEDQRRRPRGEQGAPA
jgi:biopolymer transport protein ExbB